MNGRLVTQTNSSFYITEPPMTFKNNDSPLYFRAARDAIRLEQAGKYFEAAKAWSQANRLARARSNQIWSERRSDFCFMQIKRQQDKGTGNEQST